MLRARALLKGLHSKNTFVQLVVAFGIACVYVPFMYYDPCDMLKEFAMGTVNNGTDDTSNQSDTGNKGKRAICSFFYFDAPIYLTNISGLFLHKLVEVSISKNNKCLGQSISLLLTLIMVNLQQGGLCN